ncbi:MAG: hypothetical protein R3F30_05670 [Planctomycetota bacterium]
MSRPQDVEAGRKQVDELVDRLIDTSQPKAERIRLLKELIARGEDLPEEILEEGLKRLMERLLD